MRIRQLQIERFGPWRDVVIPLTTRGLTVLHGPNEAGKSTLVRFIRGLLFGFRAEDETTSAARPRSAGCAGELVISADEDELILRRASAAGGQAELRRRAASDEESTPTLARLLGGISRDVYERVFAVGLVELQELATLHGEEVARCIYQVSLGDAGGRVLAALAKSQAARQRLLGETTGAGELHRWQRRLSELDQELAMLGETESRHDSLEQQRAELAERVDEQEFRQRGLRDQLRGHAFLERVWGPWQRQRKLRHEYDGLPEVVDFPADGVQQLADIDASIADLRRRRQQCRTARQRLAGELRQLAADREFRRHLPEVRALLQAHEVLRVSESQAPEWKSRADAARRQLDERLRRLGPNWSESRIERIDTEPASAVRLFRLADRYREAARQRARVIRAYRRASRVVQQQLSHQAAMLRRYAGADLRDARDRVRQELEELQELRQLETRHAAALRRLSDLKAASAAAARQLELPPHFFPALGVLAGAGVLLTIVGIWRFFAGGGAHVALVGAIFALLGVCSAGLTWTMKQRLEPGDDEQAQAQRRLTEAQGEVAALEREMQQLTQPVVTIADDEFDGELRIAGRDGIGDASDADEVAERWTVLTDQLAELGAADKTETLLLEQRERLSRCRERIRLLQRDVSAARRDWCAALKECGLDESVDVPGTLEVWQTVQEARRQQIQLREAQAAAQAASRAADDLGAQVGALASRIAGAKIDGRTADIVARWRTQIESAALAEQRRKSSLQELRAVKTEWRAVRRQFRQASVARRRLLAGAGAADRDEFLELDAAYRRRSELRLLIDEAADELSRCAAREPDLAIVEDDLVQFEGAANRTAIETIEAELSDLEADIQADYERLGRVEQELESLAADRRGVELRYERAQTEHEIDRVVQQLATVELAARSLEALRTGLEDEQQPALLQSAGTYLRQLTAGKYGRVWAPLGQQTLVVDDERRESYHVDQLSSGTREQLFLAIRLALIDDFLRRGVELPIVLDDLFVNFDQQRTEAAVQTVIDYAADGRQLLLFTCHQHLVRLFEAAGVSTVRLPDQSNLQDRRRVG